MIEKNQRPEWVPENGGKEYASHVVKGTKSGHDGMTRTNGCCRTPSSSNVSRRRKLSVNDYVKGVLEGNRTILGRAITLVESNSPVHMEQAQEMIKQLLPHTGNSMRVGVTGVPGAGKSTFIDALGSHLCGNGHRVAVLAVDPSSTITRGSILGDKTRMENLSRHPNAFIRPSPSGGILGGVTRKSRETILVCEAAGYDVILVETVGVGQSETAIRSMVDFFLLILIAGAGDELQGIKRGIVELTDSVLFNKADGDNRVKAEAAKVEFNRILHYLQPATRGWKTEAYTCSALSGEGITKIWSIVERFFDVTKKNGIYDQRRRSQSLDWIYSMIREYLSTRFFNNPVVKKEMAVIEKAVGEGELTPTVAVKKLVECYESSE